MYLEEEFFTSLTKDLFLSITKIKLICKDCHYTSHNFSQSQNISINPLHNKSISQLLTSDLSGDVTKFCTICKCDKLHEETISVEQRPKVLTILVNRFDSSTLGRKNNTSIIIDQVIEFHGYNYKLLSIIDHHGCHTSSGHYTCCLFFSKSNYLCNDSVVKEIDFIKYSTSAYILFYSLINWLVWYCYFSRPHIHRVVFKYELLTPQ